MDKVLLTAPPALAAGTAALNRLAARPGSGSAATPLAAALIGDAPILEAAAGDVSAARDTLNFLLRAVSRNASITAKQLRSLLEAHSDLSGAAIEVVQAAVAMVGFRARLRIDSQQLALDTAQRSSNGVTASIFCHQLHFLAIRPCCDRRKA
jgi:hypothetical protein